MIIHKQTSFSCSSAIHTDHVEKRSTYHAVSGVKKVWELIFDETNKHQGYPLRLKAIVEEKIKFTF